MFNQLNGWQRLWIVLILLYLVIVILFTTDNFPRAIEYETSRLYDSMEAVGHHLETNTPGYTFEGAYTARQKYYGKLSDEDVITRLHTKFKDKVNFTKIESEYKAKISDLTIEQSKTIGVAFLIWLIPSIALYLLGLAVAWVIGGFRREHP